MCVCVRVYVYMYIFPASSELSKWKWSAGRFSFCFTSIYEYFQFAWQAFRRARSTLPQTQSLPLYPCLSILDFTYEPVHVCVRKAFSLVFVKPQFRTGIRNGEWWKGGKWEHRLKPFVTCICLPVFVFGILIKLKGQPTLSLSLSETANNCKLALSADCTNKNLNNCAHCWASIEGNLFRHVYAMNCAPKVLAIYLNFSLLLFSFFSGQCVYN